MRQALILAAHAGAAALLLAGVVFPWSESYDYYVIRAGGVPIDFAGLLGRYALAVSIAWLCTGPLAWLAVDRALPRLSPGRRTVAAVVLGFALLFAVGVGMGTNLFFENRVDRPQLVKWMDVFLAEYQFIAFLGYAALLTLPAALTQWALRRR